MNRMLEWGIYILLFSLPLYVVRFSIGSFPTTLLEILFFTLLAGWIVAYRRNLPAQVRRLATVVHTHRVLSIIITLILLAATIGIFVAPDKLSALGVWRAYFIEPFIFFLLAVSIIDTPAKVRTSWWALLFSGVYIAVFAVFQRYTGFGIPETWLAELRVTSIYPYPNAVGLYLAPLVAMAFPLARYYCTQDTVKEKIKGIIVLMVVVLMVVAIYYAQTEAALVSLAIVGLGYGLAAAGARIRYASLLSITMIGLVVWLSPIVQQLLLPKLLLKDWSGFVRRTTWIESVSMLQNNWIFGAGLSGYQTTMVPYHKATFIEIFMFPHTIVLNVWSELGVLGIVGVSALLVWCGIRLAAYSMQLRRCPDNSEKDLSTAIVIGCAMVGCVVVIHGLVDVPYFKNDLAILLWFFFACFVSLKISGTMKSNL